MIPALKELTIPLSTLETGFICRPLAILWALPLPVGQEPTGPALSNQHQQRALGCELQTVTTMVIHTLLSLQVLALGMLSFLDGKPHWPAL